MATTTIALKKSMFVPKFYPLLFDYSHRWECHMGSAGSSKSYFVTQKLIIRAINEKIRILVCRRYASTIRNTCFSLFKEILIKWKLLDNGVKIRESDFTITFPNGSEIIFTGLDQETKLLSLNNIGCIFLEEAYEATKDVVEQLNLRLRGATPNQQIIMCWNPISRSSWLYDFCEVNPPNSFLYTHSTYKDNPFLSDEYIAAIDELEVRNPSKYRVYGLGEWGVDAEGLVITNWRKEEFDPMELAAQGLEHRAGMDLGFIDPSTVVETLYDKDNHIIYICNEFYKRGCQVSELVQGIMDMNLRKTRIYVDAAEPRTIQALRRENINAVACAKGKDSVHAGLMFLQDNLLIIHPKCKNFLNEVENFSYIKSKQTGEYTEQTTHEYSHAIDAARYAYSDIYTSNKLKTMNKSLLGL